MGLIPNRVVPFLDLPLVGGGRWTLAANPPKHFSMLLFYRGLHCPVCKAQLKDLQSRQFDFNARGVRRGCRHDRRCRPCGGRTKRLGA